MPKVKLTSRVWGRPPGTEVDLDGARLDLVLSRGYGHIINEKEAKAMDKKIKNKAIESTPKNKKEKQPKGFIGVQTGNVKNK